MCDPALYLNRDLVVSIDRVEMRRMVTPKYTDDDPQECCY